MELEYLLTKDNNKTVKINNFFLHSAYSPEKEAQRFIDNQEIDFDPKFIFVIEPGLNYCIPFLHQKFQSAQIINIRFIKDFSYTADYCKDVYFSDFPTLSHFENYFLNTFSETDLLQSAFINLPANEKIFYELNKNVLQTIKKVLEINKSILYTRGYFETRWLKNSINNLIYLNQFISISKKINKEVLIVASGTSLQNSIQIIKKYRKSFFIICVSSAISPLVSNQIIPDLCLSTDGGYWAKKHLEAYLEIKNQSILAIPLEAACQKELLQNSIILPLTYKDGISYEFEKNTNIKFFDAIRNGTVSGTALCLAQEITSKSIYFAGLDLHSCKGYQHAKPNKLSSDSISKTTKIYSLPVNFISSEFNSNSLQIYENYFINKKINGNSIFRIIDNPQNKLGQIKDITSKDFEEQCKLIQNTEENIFSNVTEISKSEKNKYLSNIQNYIQHSEDTEYWVKNLYPLDYISLNHCNKSEDKNIINNRIELKNKKLISYINKAIDEWKKNADL